MLPLSNARYSGRIAYKIDPPLDWHEVNDGPVLRRERLDVFSAVPVRFSERVLRALGREQDARLGKRDPSPLVRWQCRQGAASVASVVPSSLMASRGGTASAPNSFPIRLFIAILEVSRGLHQLLERFGIDLLRELSR